MEEQKPDNPGVKRDKNGRITAGSRSLNPAGRPKGQTLKEYIRQKFFNMTEEEKEAFIAKLDPIDIFKMAEGNPHTTTDVTSDGQAINPVLVKFVDAPNGESH